MMTVQVVAIMLITSIPIFQRGGICVHKLQQLWHKSDVCIEIHKRI